MLFSHFGLLLTIVCLSICHLLTRTHAMASYQSHCKQTQQTHHQAFQQQQTLDSNPIHHKQHCIASPQRRLQAISLKLFLDECE